MLQFIKQYRKLLIILIFPYIYLLFVLVAPTEQAVIAPGGLTEVSEVITIEGYDMVDNFNTIFVYSYYPITPFQSWVLATDRTMDIYPMTDRQKDMSKKDEYLQGQLSKYVSFKTAIIKAYELASLEKPEIIINYHYEGLYVYYRPNRLTELEIGDQIISINGNNYSDYTHNEFIVLANVDNASFLIKRSVGDTFEYLTVNYEKGIDEPSMFFYPNNVIDTASPAFEFPGLDSIVGGPSGGLLQTLSIYVSLVKLNIGDLKITGTGTMDMNGQVGRIGGITQKMYTAIYNNADIFFIPESHFSEIPNLDYPYELVRIETVEQAVQWLNERFN